MGPFYVKNLYAHCDVNGTVSVFVPWSFCETAFFVAEKAFEWYNLITKSYIC